MPPTGDGSRHVGSVWGQEPGTRKRVIPVTIRRSFWPCSGTATSRYILPLMVEADAASG